MNAIEPKFLEYHASQGDEFLAYFEEDDKPTHIDRTLHQLSKQTDLYSW